MNRTRQEQGETYAIYLIITRTVGSRGTVWRNIRISQMRKIRSKRILHHNIKKATAQFIKTHQKKFKNLTCNTSLPFTSNETVTNISSHSLTSEQLFISSFSFGLFLCFFIRKLRKNKNIVILKPDKGIGVVVLDRTDYNQGILKIINDTSKFRPIKGDPTLLREGRLQRLLRKLNKNGHLDNGVYENIYLKASKNLRPSQNA